MYRATRHRLNHTARCAGSRLVPYVHTTAELKPGMLMEIHPNVFVPGVAGAMIGDMVAVTDTSCEILTDYPRDLISW